MPKLVREDPHVLCVNSFVYRIYTAYERKKSNILVPDKLRYMKSHARRVVHLLNPIYLTLHTKSSVYIVSPMCIKRSKFNFPLIMHIAM